jgi:hypothetical protein
MLSRRAKIVIGATTVAVAVTLLLAQQVRRRRRAKADHESLCITPHSILRIVGSSCSAVLGEAIHYPPRITTVPVVNCAGLEVAFVILDDLCNAPRHVVDGLGEVADQPALLDVFLRLYLAQCRFLSEAGRHAPLQRATDAAQFTHVVASSTFTGYLLLDAEHGIVVTLVAVGTASAVAESALRLAQSLEYAPPPSSLVDGDHFEVQVPEEAGSTTVWIPAAGLVPRDVDALNTADEVAAASRVMPAHAANVKRHHSEALQCAGTQCTFVSESLGVRFKVADGARVFTHRLITFVDRSPSIGLTYVIREVDEDLGPRFTFERLPVPIEWVLDDDALLRCVRMQFVAATAGSGPQSLSDCQLTTLAGRRAVVVNEASDDGQRACRTYVCPVGARRLCPSHGDFAEVLLVRCECAAGVPMTPLLVGFLDTFFIAT